MMGLGGNQWILWLLAIWYTLEQSEGFCEYILIITGCFDIGKDYHGGVNIDVVRSILTPTACQAECQKLPECQYWTLNENNNNCIRKRNKPSTPSAVSHATSGPKYCQNGKVV